MNFVRFLAENPEGEGKWRRLKRKLFELKICQTRVPSLLSLSKGGEGLR